MQSIIDLLGEQQTWEEFLTYRLLKGRFNWYEFDEADTYVSEAQYRDVVGRLQRGEPLSVPTRHLVNKMGSGKKRMQLIERVINETFELFSLPIDLFHICGVPVLQLFIRCGRKVYRRAMTGMSGNAFQSIVSLEGKGVWFISVCQVRTKKI